MKLQEVGSRMGSTRSSGNIDLFPVLFQLEHADAGADKPQNHLIARASMVGDSAFSS